MFHLTPAIGQATRILIVDDHPIVREGLCSIISKHSDLVVCGEADDVASALSLVEQTKPHVVIVDISLRSGSGLELIRRIVQLDSSIRMIVCSLYDELLYAERALKAGALGYVNKHEATHTIIKAIRQILEKRVYLSDRMTERLANRLLGPSSRQERMGVESFTERELEVFQGIGSGLTSMEIARKLNLGIKTIETHRRRIKFKLKITNTSQLAREATQWLLEHK